MVRYDGFISYSQAKDKTIAMALQRAVQKLGKPWYRRRALRLFRDASSLSATPQLWPAIELALSQSRFFILLASPESAKSKWVNREVTYWIEHNSIHRLLIGLTSGELAWNDAATDFIAGDEHSLPPALLKRFPSEPKWVDLRAHRPGADKRDAKFTELAADFAAAIRGMPKEDLLSEEVRLQRGALRLAWGASAALFILTLTAATAGVLAYVAEREAVAQRGVAERNEATAKRQRDSALIAQSRFLAERVNQDSAGGDPGSGLLLALEALPDSRAGVARPYAPEPEAGAYQALQRLWDIRIMTPARGTVSMARDGSIVAPASENAARIWAWQAAKMAIAHDLTGHTGRVNAAVYSPEGKRIVTASEDKSARVWDAGSGQTLVVLAGHTGAVTGAAFSPDGLRMVTASIDKTACIWDLATGKIVKVLAGHKGDVLSVAFSADGKLIVTASDDGTARIWDAESGESLKELKDTTAVNAAAFSPDGKQIVTALGDMDTGYQDVFPRPARIWNLETERPVLDLKGHTGPVRSAAFSPDGRYLITGSNDGTARYWDAKTGRALTVMAAHTGAVTSAVFNPDGRYRVTASDDGTARVWDSVPGPTTIVLGTAIMTPETSIAELVKSFRNPSADPVDSQPPDNAALSADGRRLVASSVNNTAVVWDVATRRRLAELIGHTARVRSASFSPNGAFVVTASADKTARIWEAASGKAVAMLSGHTNTVESAAFSADGKQVITAAADNTARIWDAGTGRMIRVLLGHTERNVDAAFSPDGGRVVTASDDKTARIWEARSGRELFALSHAERVATARFSPDGHGVITAAGDAAPIWNADTGEKISELAAEAIQSAVFSPDGQRALTSSHEETFVRVWDVASSRTIVTVPVLPANPGMIHISTASLSGDGQHMVAVVQDGTARIWKVYPTVQDMLDYIKRWIPRCLTGDQRKAAFLDGAPPIWCIEMEKWPYDTDAWRSWLAQKKAGLMPPLPQAP